MYLGISYTPVIYVYNFIIILLSFPFNIIKDFYNTVLDGSWFKHIYTSSKAVTPICVLYIKIPLIKGLRFLKYKSSLSL